MTEYMGHNFKADSNPNGVSFYKEHETTADSKGYIINPYFSERELRCKGSGILLLEPKFMERLIQLRQEYDAPLYVNSCCRSPEHNAKIGGHRRSLHMTTNPHHKNQDTGEPAKTLAIDINRKLIQHLDVFLEMAEHFGFTIGIANSFIHLDARTDVVGLPQTRYYYKGAKQ